MNSYIFYSKYFVLQGLYKKYIIFSILKENILEKNLEKIAFEFNKFIIFEIFFNQRL